MTKNQFGTTTFEKHVFERERLGIDYRLSKRDMEAMKGWEMSRFEADMGRSIVWRVQTMMAHGDRTITATEDVPVTWWDHLKDDINLWALDHLKHTSFFFTNIAKAIICLCITPKTRTIEKSILVKRYCPHIAVGDNKPHVEFMLSRPSNYDWEDELQHRLPRRRF